MNRFIEKNEGLLKNYSIVARIIGWLFLFSGCLNGIGGSIVMLTKLDQYQNFQAFFCAIPFRDLNNIFVGLFALWCSRFIRFLSDANYKQDWLLRYATKLLYCYAGIVLVYNFIAIVGMHGFGFEQIGNIIGRIIIFVLFGCIWSIAFVGLGFILRHIMPVIEESKTLV
jgi:hypothetical protein